MLSRLSVAASQREQSDGLEARLPLRLALSRSRANLQLRALREIDPAIAAIKADSGDFAQLRQTQLRADDFGALSTGRRRFPSASRRRDTNP